MPMTVADLIYDRVKELPEPLAREVLQFVEKLRFRRADPEARDLIEAQAASLAPVWDNVEDEVWDNA